MDTKRGLHPFNLDLMKNRIEKEITYMNKRLQELEDATGEEQKQYRLISIPKPLRDVDFDAIFRNKPSTHELVHNQEIADEIRRIKKRDLRLQELKDKE